MLSHALRKQRNHARANAASELKPYQQSKSNHGYENKNFETLLMVNGVCPNFIQFRDSALSYCLSELGPVANIISTNSRYLPSPVIEPSQILNDTNDPHRTKRLMHEQKVKNYENELHQLESISEPKLFGLLWGNCSEESKDRIMRCQVVVDDDEEHEGAIEPADITYINDWDDVFNKSDAIRLWDRILNTHVGTDTGILILNSSDAKTKYERNHQLKSESLIAYKSRFKFLLETCDAYTSTGTMVIESQAEQAVRFVNGLDNSRYAQFRANLVNNANNGSAPYPDTWQKAFDLASKFKVVSTAGQVVEAAAFHTPTSKSKHSNSNDSKSALKKKSGDNKKGTTNNQPRKVDSNSNQCNKDCPICQDKAPTHWQRDCPVVQKAKEIHLEESGKAKDTSNTTASRKGRVNVAFSREVLSDCGDVLHSFPIGDPIQISTNDTSQEAAIYMNVSFNTAAHPNITNMHVLHDNQANVSIFCNKELLTNIRKADVQCHVGGINADGSPLIAKLIGDFNEFRGVYYHPDASANILSFSETAAFCINSYIPERQSFTCTPPSGNTYEFHLIDGLYAFEVTRQVFTTVTQNSQAYTKREVSDAEKARELIRRLGIPSEASAIEAINRGSIINSPVTANDIHRATKIFGKDIASLRGKTHKQASLPIKDPRLPRQVPSDVTFNTDIMFVGGHAFLLSVLTPIGQTICNHLGFLRGKRTTPVVRQALDKQISETSARRFNIVALNTDGEGAVHSCGTEIGHKGIELNPTGAGAHVPVVERKIQEVKERARGIINTLPFKLALSLIVWLIFFCVSRINLLPHKGSPIGIAPSEAFRSRKTDAKLDLRCGFGDYAEVVDPYADNSMKPRTQAAIALLPIGNLTGSVNFLSLATGRVIRRDQFTVLPMPDTVIQHLNKMAELSYSKANLGPDAPELNFAMASTTNLISNTVYDSRGDTTSLYDVSTIDITEPLDVIADDIDPDPGIVPEEHTADIGPISIEPAMPIEPDIPENHQFTISPSRFEVPIPAPSDITDPDPGTAAEVPATVTFDPDPADDFPGPGTGSDTSPIDYATADDDPPTPDPESRYFTRSSVRGASSDNLSVTERARLAAIRRNTISNKGRAFYSASVHHITVNKAMKTMSKHAIKSMFKEVGQMVDKKVFKGVEPSFKYKKKVIKSFMFL